MKYYLLEVYNKDQASWVLTELLTLETLQLNLRQQNFPPQDALLHLLILTFDSLSHELPEDGSVSLSM